jgi:hypothetical protein
MPVLRRAVVCAPDVRLFDVGQADGFDQLRHILVEADYLIAAQGSGA